MSGQVESRETLLVESSDLTSHRGRRNSSVYHQLFEVLDDHPFHDNPGGCNVCSTPHAATGHGVVWANVLREDGPHTPVGYAHLAVSDAEWEASHRHVTVERLATTRVNDESDPTITEPAGAQLCLRCGLVASPTLPPDHVHVEPDPQSNRLYQQSAVAELTAEEYRDARNSSAAIEQFTRSYTSGDPWRRATVRPFTAYRSDFYDRWIERRPDWIEELAPGLEVVRPVEAPGEMQVMNSLTDVNWMEIGTARGMIEYAEADAEWARQLSARLADRCDRIDRFEIGTGDGGA